MDSKDIRKNDGIEEKEVARGECSMPKWLSIVMYIFFGQALLAGLFGIILYIVSDYEDNSGLMLASFNLVIGIVFLSLWIFYCMTVKKSHCIVTNKRIYGVKAVFFIKQQYSYRLDMIDQVEVGSALGLNTLTLRFRGDGAIGQNAAPIRAGVNNGTFVINLLKKNSADNLYQKISEEIMKIKNDKDVQIDIELKKAEAEEKKANAFMAMAQNVMGGGGQKQELKNDDYITQLERLSELKEKGIITEEEFQEKKKELLSK